MLVYVWNRDYGCGRVRGGRRGGVGGMSAEHQIAMKVQKSQLTMYDVKNKMSNTEDLDQTMSKSW